MQLIHTFLSRSYPDPRDARTSVVLRLCRAVSFQLSVFLLPLTVVKEEKRKKKKARNFTSVISSNQRHIFRAICFRRSSIALDRVYARNIPLS